LLKVDFLSETVGSGVNFCWERRRASQVWQKPISFGQAEQSACIMHLCGGW